MLDMLKSLINLDLANGLVVEAEAHKERLAELVATLDEQVLKQLIDLDSTGG